MAVASCLSGSVRDVLNTHFPTGLPEYAVSFILRDLLYALDYIHVRGYIHRQVIFVEALLYFHPWLPPYGATSLLLFA